MDESIQSYMAFTSQIFSSKSKRGPAEFNHLVFEHEMKRLVVSRTLDAETFLAHSGANTCKTFVVTTRARASGSPVLMRTYDTAYNDAFPATIWQASRATSATPKFFSPITIDGITYVDGGLSWNNPTELALNETRKIWPNRSVG